MKFNMVMRMAKKSVYQRRFNRKFKDGSIRYAGCTYRPIKGLDYSGLEGMTVTVEKLGCAPDFFDISELFYVPSKAQAEVIGKKDLWHSILLVRDQQNCLVNCQNY